MLRKAFAILAGLTAILALAALATAPADIEELPPAPAPGEDLGDWLATAEMRVTTVTPIIPGAEKRIRWHDDSRGRRTHYSVVYLHGFSATRQEMAPVAESVADGLAANLFETRLAGHGLESMPLTDVTAEDWLADGVESLAIGRRLGERIVLIGTSTGATLALALSGHELFDSVDTLVLISPNFAPRDETAELLVRPGGPQMARLMIGETRSWTPFNDQQARYWSTSYPTEALVEMMRLVRFTRDALPMTLDARVLALYSPKDEVINTALIETSLAQVDTPQLEVVPIESSGDPSHHILAGDILSPDNNDAVVDRVIRFVQRTGL